METLVQQHTRRIRHGESSPNALSRSGKLRHVMVMIFCLLVSAASIQVAEAQKHRATVINLDGEVIAGPGIQAKVQDNDEARSIHVDDSLALVAMYHSMQGDAWNDNGGWLSERVEFWVGVNTVEEVDVDEWRVTVLNFPRNNMTVPGPIPPDIKDMKYLRSFFKDVNLISGEFPAEYGELPDFEIAEHRNNLFTGEIPWEALGQLRRFQRISVRSNFVHGDLPAWFGENMDDGEPWFPNIQRIHIDENEFSGQIPASLNNRETLQSVLFSGNLLTGDIPDWSNLELNDYRIDKNDLTPGSIPDWMQAWADSPLSFNIANTNRTGVIPDWMGNMNWTNIDGIGGKYDEIGGEIPASIQFMSNLRRFRLEDGTWTGSMPPWLSNMPTLQWVEFLRVDFTGTLPAEYANIDRWSRFVLTGSQVEGGIPEIWQTATGIARFEITDVPTLEVGNIPQWLATSWGGLQDLALKNVGLTGTIPENMGGLLNLRWLNLEDNPNLVGDLPSWLPNANLQRLRLSNTGLNITEVPTFIQNWTNFQQLSLGGYGIEGQIPAWLGGGNFAPTLRILALDDNNFDGPIPVELGNLLLVDSLNLAHNNLTGELPPEIANVGRATDDLVTLQSLVLSGNAELTGELPARLRDAQFLRVLEFDGTDICEPDDFDEWAAAIEEYATTKFYPEAYFSVKGSGIKCSDRETSAPDVSDVPRTVQLHVNYPNPFNPSTNIRYDIPSEMNVRLAVYNVLGQRVATLVNEVQTGGQYEVQFDARNITSGTYIYRLETDQQSISRQMMLIK